MMTKEDIINLIKNNISDNKEAIITCTRSLDEMKIMKSGQKLGKLDFGKMLVLKDRLVFHKGATLALDDLLRSIENEQS